MRRTTWTLLVAGMLSAGLGLHLVVTQPLHRQIDSLTSEVSELHSGIRQLADYRDEVAGTNDLLSGLELQSQHVTQARAAIENMRRLEREVILQSQSANDAARKLASVARLQSDVIAQCERAATAQRSLDELARCQQRTSDLADSTQQLLVDIELAEESLQQLGNFQQRVALESSGIDVAENRFARLVDLKHSIAQVEPAAIATAEQRLDEIDNLTQHVLSAGQPLQQAREVAVQLIALQDEIVTRGARVDVAGQHAQQLLALEELLANDAGRDIQAATQNLAALLELEEQLAAQDQHLAAAIESLELLRDLQSEFVERTRDLESMRRGLTELIMMESMIARTVRSLQPLASLADLRRLDPAQLRSIARSMIADGEERVAARDTQTPTGSTPSIRQEEELTPHAEQLVPIPPAE